MNVDIDIFKALGLKKADSNSALGQTDTANPIPYFMPITFNAAGIMNVEGTAINIVLPYNHDKGIQDSVSARITNQWGDSQSNALSNYFSKKAQDLATTLPGIDKVSGFIRDSLLFKYDAGSAKKTLTIPFIVPLGLATMEKLKKDHAAKEMRKAFNKLQGMIFPTNSAKFMPPLLTMTIGGMYQSFYGFITNVTINPTNNDMFQDPDTGEYFNLVYDGTITFENLFIYYHNNNTTGADKFDIDSSTIEVLFGSEELTSKKIADKSIIGIPTNGDMSYYLGTPQSRQSVQNLLFSDVATSRIYLYDNKATQEKNDTSANMVFALPEEFVSSTRAKNKCDQILKFINESTGTRSIIGHLNDDFIKITSAYTVELRHIKDADANTKNKIWLKYEKKIIEELDATLADLASGQY